MRNIESSSAGGWVRGAVSLVLLAIHPGVAQADARWTDDFTGRLEVLALMEELDADLLASTSATNTLEAWCADHHMATLARLNAIALSDAQKPLDEGGRAVLDVKPGEPLRYRHVELVCGSRVLSEAENWYVPARLTPGMNHLLDTTKMPFGRVVSDLHPVRQTLSVERLWSPLPSDWDRHLGRGEMQRGASRRLAIPDRLFRHRAVLLDSQRRPIALVVETYRSGVLDF